MLRPVIGLFLFYFCIIKFNQIVIKILLEFQRLINISSPIAQCVYICFITLR
jgi:hypothetical protein